MATGHNFRKSGYERRSNEQYFTAPWCTRALVQFIPAYVQKRAVWEPAAGRGDIVKVLIEHGYDVSPGDIDPSNWDYDLGKLTQQDFLGTEPSLDTGENFSAVITNPPYGGGNVLYDGRKMSPAEAFIRHSIAHGIDYIAMLLRTDFNHSQKRRDLFEGDAGIPFAQEIVLTSRPRWDWWEEADPWEERKSPMHNFSWFVWDAKHKGDSTQKWVHPSDLGEKITEEEDDDGV